MSNSITVFTVQDSGHNITVQHKHLDENTGDKATYINMARYLGWNCWIWAFQDLKDFNNDWMDKEKLLAGDIWTLSVPREAVKWCALKAQRESQTPLWSWFSRDPDIIRKAGDMPQCLIKVPVLPIWVSEKTSAEEAFAKSGVW